MVFQFLLIGLLPTSALQCDGFARPDTVETAEGTSLAYEYDGERGTYTLTVKTTAGQVTQVSELAVRPTNCQPAELKWESANFVILQENCGSMCSHAVVVPVGKEADYQSDQLERLFLPVSFSATSETLAAYDQVDGAWGLMVENLSTGERKMIEPESSCPFIHASYCIRDVEITDGNVEYVWQRGKDQPAKHLTVPLAESGL